MQNKKTTAILLAVLAAAFYAVNVLSLIHI